MMKKRFLQNTPLFAVLSDEERQSLADRFELRQIEDGTTIFERGALATEILLIKSGVVRLFDEAGQMLATFGPSSLLGEIDLLLNRNYATRAVAHGPVDGWFLTRDALGQTLATHPSISIKLSGILGERIADLDYYLVERLKNVPILSGLDDAVLKALAQKLNLENARRGALIFQAGAAAMRFYIVESGTVTIVSTAHDDPDPFRQLGVGEVFGHEALLRGRQYGAVARAATDVQLWTMSRHDFETITALHPTLREALSLHINEAGLEPADRAAARNALAALPLFDGVGEAVLDNLASRLTLRHVNTNETIFNEGDPSDALYLVDRGTVRLFDGPVLLEERTDGEAFGESALITGAPREVTTRAPRPTNLWVLAKRDFDSVAVRHPELTTAISAILTQILASEASDEAAATEMLARFPLFTSLSPREQADVARHLKRISAEADEVVFRQGTVADGFYLVQRGQVRLSNEHGTFNIVRPGGFFGEMALLTGNNHSISAQAIEDSDFLVLDRLQFDAVVNRYPKVALVLSRALGARLEEANQRLQPMMAAAPIPPPRAALQPAVAAPASPARVVTTPRQRPVAAREIARARDPWAPIKFALVLVPLLWLVGITAPTLLMDIAANPASPVHWLTQVGR